MCGGLGSGSMFRKVPKSSGMCWYRFPEASSGRFRRVPVCAGVVPGSSSGKLCVLVWVVPEGSGAC